MVEIDLLYVTAQDIQKPLEASLSAISILLKEISFLDNSSFLDIF